MFGDFMAFFVFFRFSAKRPKTPQGSKKGKQIFFKKAPKQSFFKCFKLPCHQNSGRSKQNWPRYPARARERARNTSENQDISYIVKKGHFWAFLAKKRRKILNCVIILHNIIFHNNWRPWQDYIWFTGPFYSVF